MPVLCMFYGIIVRMYKEIGGKHNMPHIHVEYSGQEAVIESPDEACGCLDGNP